MKNFTIVTAAALAALIAIPTATLARSSLPAPNWDEGLAVETANVPSAEAEVRELFRLMNSANRAEFHARLDALISGGGMPQPERDAVLFRFTQGLADLDHVDAQLVERLRGVRPYVYVSHPERAYVGVPLYDIAAAAEGVHQLNLRREARWQAEAGLGGAPATWLERYRTASRAGRAGYVDALSEASDEWLARLLGETLDQLAYSPDLTPVSGKAALLLRDSAAVKRVVSQGGGAEISYVLEAAGVVLPAEDAQALLAFAIAEASPSTAAVAIAQLYPRLASQPGANQLLFDLLGDSELGGAAALALASSGGPAARVGLRDVAANGEGLAARRARTALGMSAQYGESQ